MKKRAEDGVELEAVVLPGWVVSTKEVSAGIYRLRVEESSSGANFEISGSNPDEMLERARQYVVELETKRRKS